MLKKLITALLIFPGFVVAGALAAEPPSEPVLRLRVEGIIDPASAQYVARGLDQAERQHARLVLLLLDTPGGLDRSMRQITERILNARVPVAVYISPAGARAASAGAFITLAAPLAAMAPGTNLGAAHPVDLQGKSASVKITNDAAAYLESLARLRHRPEEWARQAVRASLSTPAEEAVRLGVVDFTALDEAALLQKLEGRTVILGREARQLALAGAPVADVPMNLGERFLHVLANPNLSYVLFLIGIYGLIYELASPGAILPGVAGAIAILLAMIGFEGLPVSLTGLLLLALGGFLLILEPFVVSHGILAVGGLAALISGSLIVFPGSAPAFRVATSVMVGMLATTAAFIVFILWILISGRKRTKVVSGVESLIGARGVVKQLTPDGALVHVQGEDWLAEEASGQALAPAESVEVVAVAGLTLKVRKA
jgi:membrane-bound serine protease (ClpP class)